MATNFYFNNFTNSQEQHLIEDLVTESIKIYGHDVYYVPRTIVARDSLYNQDDLSTFDSAYLVDMYIKNVEGFEGEGDLFQRFGVEIRDQITFVISQRTFDLEISTATSLLRPKEGDLIFLPLNNKPFEIKFVEHEAVFYQMGSLQTYEMTCELYEYSGERFNTGITSIDNIENLNAPSTQLYVESVSGNYVIDETVYVSLPLIAGEQATATLTPSLSGDTVSIAVANGGLGYESNTTITVSGPDDANGAQARARMDVNASGTVTSVTMLDAGSGYLSIPTLTIPSPGNNVVKATVAKITANTSESGSYTLELNNLAANTNTLQFANGQILIGATSGATGTINDGNITEETFDEEAQNEFFESEGDNILDFTDRDPFSEGGSF